MDDERKDELMHIIEELSEMELNELDLRKKLSSKVSEDDIEHINAMPLLYRMELKRLLERHDNPLAAKIKA